MYVDGTLRGWTASGTVVITIDGATSVVEYDLNGTLQTGTPIVSVGRLSLSTTMVAVCGNLFGHVGTAPATTVSTITDCIGLDVIEPTPTAPMTAIYSASVCGNLGSVSTIIAAITPTSVSLYTPLLTTTVFSSRIRNGSTYAVYVSDGSGPLPASTISKFPRDNFCGYAVHFVFLTLFILFFFTVQALQFATARIWCLVEVMAVRFTTKLAGSALGWRVHRRHLL